MSSIQPLALDQLLSGKSEPLRQLLTARYPSPFSAQLQPLSTTQVTDLLGQLSLSTEDKLTEALTATLEATESVGPYEYAVLCFVEDLLARYSSDNHLDTAINQVLGHLRPLMAAQILQNNNWLWDKQHPLQRCMHLIQRSCCGWSTEQGSAATRFLEKLYPLITALATSKNISEQQQCLTALQTFFDQQQLRREKLQGRVCDTERGSLQARHAQQLAAKTLNQRMAGKKLPQSIVTFLKEHWLESLRLHILKVSEQSDKWRQLIIITEQLINSVQPDQPMSERYQAVEELPELLRNSTLSINQYNDKIEEQLALISAEHLKLLKGESLEYCPFSLIDNTNPLTSSCTQISKGLLKQIEAIKTGQWFFDYCDDEQAQRIQLLLKMESEHQLLFSNVMGAKAAQYSYEEFAYRLGSQRAFALHMDLSITSSANKLLEGMVNVHNHQQEKQAREEQLQEQQRLEAQRKAQAEAKALAKLEREKQQRLQREAEREAQRQQEQQRQQDAEQERVSREQFERINVGALIEFSTPQQVQTLKLAVRLKSTGRHIFTDEAGIKKLELSSDELLSLFIKQQAKIIRLGDEFESSLSKVVDGIRNNKRKGDI